ncbi:hypothetical protein P3T23_008055 [Paraburkholderia sp. GAS448]|uniref:ribbon-helix-helix protein, CopG family n=1 Tax=Paraburkholderia sp. GAS448 TaxID=3035136 RepID=UPI003D1FF306
MRPPRKRPKTRLNLDMHPEVKEQLEKLRDRIHADSMGEVIRRALAVYDYLHCEQSNGATMVIRTRDGTEKGLPIL